jgi:thiol-disulfide isomerase/thioredoxin
MSTSNKALLIIIAISAFIIGVSLNPTKLDDDSEIETLLNAQLLLNQSSAEQSTVRNHLGKLTLVNFWATWCSPCRDEMPLFENVFRRFSKNGFTVLGITIDSQNKAQPMLDSMDISYPILYAEQTGMQLMSAVGNSNGLLPFSLLLDEHGKILDRKLGKIDEQQINEWLDEFL